MLVSTSKPSVRGRSVSREKYRIVTGFPSSCKLKSDTERFGRSFPCLSRTVANKFTTRTFDDTVGEPMSSPAGTAAAIFADAGAELWLKAQRLITRELLTHRIRLTLRIKLKTQKRRIHNYLERRMQVRLGHRSKGL